MHACYTGIHCQHTSVPSSEESGLPVQYSQPRMDVTRTPDLIFHLSLEDMPRNQVPSNFGARSLVLVGSSGSGRSCQEVLGRGRCLEEVPQIISSILNLFTTRSTSSLFGRSWQLECPALLVLATAPSLLPYSWKDSETLSYCWSGPHISSLITSPTPKNPQKSDFHWVL